MNKSTEKYFRKGSQALLANDFETATTVFTTMTLSNPHDIRGWIGRADTALAWSCQLLEDYQEKGGEQFWLNKEELLSPVSKPLRPPEQQKWWDLNVQIMKLQASAKEDYQKALELDPDNPQAQKGISALRELGALP